MADFIYPFSELTQANVAEVGGKNASLGEMFRELSKEGVRVPDGFATSTEAYWNFIHENELEKQIRDQLNTLDTDTFSNLNEVGQNIRERIMNAEMPGQLAEAIETAYAELEEREEDVQSVAIRSSATAEDLPEASFAGQHESFLNIGRNDVVDTVQKCFASAFTDRAIKYREDQGFDHLEVALSAGVQKMVRSGESCSGVAFTIDPDSGFEDVIFINGSWGLGDYIVGGEVLGDQFYLFKNHLDTDKLAIISKEPGKKERKLVYAESMDESGQNTKEEITSEEERRSFILEDDEIGELGRWCLRIEEHYERPMDIEWAKDGGSGLLYIVQARPETVHSSKEDRNILTQYSLTTEAEPLVTGRAIGDKIAAGTARVLASPDESDKLKEGDVLITTITNPDWDPVMEKASAIVTDSGGRTSHAAIVAREMGTVAVVGTEDATTAIKDGQELTVSCAEGQTGAIYDSVLEWEEHQIDTEELGDPETDVELILANPRLAFKYAPYPVDGVGLMRLEFAINNSIRVHPLALVHYDQLEDEEVKKEIDELTAAFQSRQDYFIEKLSMAVGTIAAAFYPREVIVRMSDFKSNEYAGLLGGKPFEPSEENPMLGFRGASRYTSEAYREAFRLECLAMKRARDTMGLDNIKLMIPFCRTTDEAEKVVAELANHGLRQGENNLELFVMVELPSNVTGLEDFSEIFDGFSIGSNDLTQLTLGVDRDSERVSDIFDERNDQVRDMIATAIEKAKHSDRKIGLCGQAPSDFPEYARFLVERGIDSISFSPDAVASGIRNILEAEG